MHLSDSHLYTTTRVSKTFLQHIANSPTLQLNLLLRASKPRHWWYRVHWLPLIDHAFERATFPPTLWISSTGHPPVLGARVSPYEGLKPLVLCPMLKCVAANHKNGVSMVIIKEPIFELDRQLLLTDPPMAEAHVDLVWKATTVPLYMGVNCRITSRDALTLGKLLELTYIKQHVVWVREDKNDHTNNTEWFITSPELLAWLFRHKQGLEFKLDLSGSRIFLHDAVFVPSDAEWAEMSDKRAGADEGSAEPFEMIARSVIPEGEDSTHECDRMELLLEHTLDVSIGRGTSGRLWIPGHWY